MDEVLSHLEGDADFDLVKMRDFAQYSLDLVFLLTEERGKPEVVVETPTEKLRNTVGLRLRLPGKVEVKAVQVNGRELPAGPMNGYSVWDTPNGFRMLQANLAPDFAAGSRFVMMVRWE